MNEEEKEKLDTTGEFLQELGDMVLRYYTEPGLSPIDIIACLDIVKMHIFIQHHNNLLDWDAFDENFERGVIQ